MKLRRYLRPESIQLSLRTQDVPEGEDPKEFDVTSPRNVNRVREEVLGELTSLFVAAGQVSNATKFHRELVNRERKAPTSIGSGVAVPHLRTLQVKSFVMVFARSAAGVTFHAPDDEPVRLFFGLAAPPYDDRTYLKVYRGLGKLLLDQDSYRSFLTVEQPSEVLRALELVS